MSADMLPAERHQFRYERTRGDSGWWDGYQTGRHDRWLVAGICGGLLGYLIGRRHHPLVWVCLAGLVLAIGVVVLALFPYVAVAVAITIVARWRASGRSWSRIGATFGVVLSGVVVSLLVLATLGPGPALLAMAGSWGLWHVAGRQRLARL
jgi:Na+/melibiose symporter-like transporter